MTGQGWLHRYMFDRMARDKIETPKATLPFSISHTMMESGATPHAVRGPVDRLTAMLKAPPTPKML